jgi:hypothetical protein
VQYVPDIENQPTQPIAIFVTSASKDSNLINMILESTLMFKTYK